MIGIFMQYSFLRNRWLYFALLLLLLFGGYKALKPSTRKHHRCPLVEKLAQDEEIRKEWEIPISAEQIAQLGEIVKQPFFFLGKGKQCYAFQSQDGRYVLKFLKYKSVHAPKMKARFLARRVKKYKLQRREKRLQELGNSLKLSFLALPEATGTLFLHLNPSQGLPNVTLVDEQGNLEKIELDSRKFLIQQKACCIKPEIISLMYAGKETAAQSRLDQILALFVECAKNGICDRDGALIRNNNLGFIADRAIYIDTGKFAQAPDKQAATIFVAEARRQLKPLHKWLNLYYPDLARYFITRQEQLQEQMNQARGSKGFSDVLTHPSKP
jgi:hypothetical protein